MDKWRLGVVRGSQQWASAVTQLLRRMVRKNPASASTTAADVQSSLRLQQQRRAEAPDAPCRQSISEALTCHTSPALASGSACRAGWVWKRRSHTATVPLEEPVAATWGRLGCTARQWIWRSVPCTLTQQSGCRNSGCSSDDHMYGWAMADDELNLWAGRPAARHSRSLVHMRALHLLLAAAARCTSAGMAVQARAS